MKIQVILSTRVSLENLSQSNDFHHIFSKRFVSSQICLLTQFSKPDYTAKSMQNLKGSGFHFQCCKNFSCGQVLSAMMADRLQKMRYRISMKHYPGLNQLRTQGQSCQTADDCQICTFNFLGIHIFHRELYCQCRV